MCCAVLEAREGPRPLMERVGLVDSSSLAARGSTVDTAAATGASSSRATPTATARASGGDGTGAMVAQEPGAMVDSQVQDLARVFGRRPFSANRRFVSTRK